ncbi:hypothetical protein [Lentzea sp. HUAS12]|uniref:hypothetical protein n=1 Tax=Lentzea sp. HUAS12 TaxID=2951806 RepID=UPI00209D1419|nr:hypothetical protein [Lentzea sp. HUAS12]USX48211.1 hypothetical protein ND450_22235 [Lentzea sp. HUAS12]
MDDEVDGFAARGRSDDEVVTLAVECGGTTKSSGSPLRRGGATKSSRQPQRRASRDELVAQS